MAINNLKSYFPEWYEEWLFTSLAIKHGSETDEKYLEPLFNLNKNWLKENYDKEETVWNDDEVAKAYALYYMTINIPKLWMVLENSNSWKPENISSIVEFGCGPGTFLWAFLFYLKKKHPEALRKLSHVRAIDNSPANLNVATKLFRGLNKYDEFKHLTVSIIEEEWQENYKNDSSDLKIFGNSLVETTDSMDLLFDSPFNNMLIIEPGTLKHFQRLRKIRDKFAKDNVTIHFPCSAGKQCPMAQDNWCHFHVNRFLLPFIQRMSNVAGRKNHRHNFSAFLFENGKATPKNQNWRILSKTRKAKGTAIRYICNGDRVFEAVLNKKEKSDSNRDFIKCDTGSLCYCSNDLNNGKIKANYEFTTVKP
jgi:ribosomal protein RSM22 (predicted rRNA methylase)